MTIKAIIFYSMRVKPKEPGNNPVNLQDGTFLYRYLQNLFRDLTCMAAVLQLSTVK